MENPKKKQKSSVVRIVKELLKEGINTLQEQKRELLKSTKVDEELKLVESK